MSQANLFDRSWARFGKVFPKLASMAVTPIQTSIDIYKNGRLNADLFMFLMTSMVLGSIIYTISVTGHSMIDLAKNISSACLFVISNWIIVMSIVYFLCGLFSKPSSPKGTITLILFSLAFCYVAATAITAFLAPVIAAIGGGHKYGEEGYKGLTITLYMVVKFVITTVYLTVALGVPYKIFLAVRAAIASLTWLVIGAVQVAVWVMNGWLLDGPLGCCGVGK
jgi:hypothetical protein